ncbi:Scarecrow-like protein 14 [Abeliophyllum distichum]|uniref:Scarecrow-like protein 14 n=1 Tax=Abeliophyllum distichum TaxID=126358 RepID=A0ABD1RDE1_9LAMI
MDVVEQYLAPKSDFKFNFHSKSVFPEENYVNGCKINSGFKDFSVLSNGSSSPADGSPSEGETHKENDHSDEIFKFISQMLMEEEDLENKPCMLQDSLALQAAEKCLYDVLNGKSPCSSIGDPFAQSPNDNLTNTCSAFSSESSSDSIESKSYLNQGHFEPLIQYSSLSNLQSNLQSFGSSNSVDDAVYGLDDFYMNAFRIQNSLGGNNFGSKSSGNGGEINSLFPNDGLFSSDLDPKKKVGRSEAAVVKNGEYLLQIDSREKKNRYWEDAEFSEEHRSSKQLANNNGESEPLEMYDKVLLCPALESDSGKMFQRNEKLTGSNRGRPRGGKRQGFQKEVVDLRSLLMQCAQAVASYDSRTVNEHLVKIRQHSSPHGDETERLSHYFAKALEARMAGTGTASYTAFGSSRISASEILKSYHTAITACPYKKMSNFFANRSIRKLATGATRLHIIDFGILYGFQWPCLIKALSERPGGPPELRITGIDFPQPGFRPAGRVEETGSRLTKYCKRFNVPFKFNAIAKKWETVQLEELKIDKNELLIVNSLYRLHNVPDETVIANSPRDAVLNLIKRINPDMYIEGVVNGTYNTPFFITRFREALFHFSSMFDMFEATLPREDPERILYEKEFFGKDALNIIACEGTERVDRPETYKQWQVRNLRAGFRQLPLDQEIVKFIRNKVKLNYHKDFSVDEDGEWMLQGWKGRVLYALSCWQPAHK